MGCSRSWGFRRGAKHAGAAVLVLLALTGCGGVGAWSQPPVPPAPTYEGMTGSDLASRIANGDGSDEARKALRGLGPGGFEAVLAGYDTAVAEGADAAALQRLSAAADTAAEQRDAIHSRLYWYTDLEEAERAAQREHKPILSLRMLGRLEDELSCANSRFFRTMLYPDRAVNARMRQGFVLHWSSERPVPIVTIDYGDGRVVRRTITGNSIHYILDPHGHVVDALPGLYSSAAFAQGLEVARSVALSTDSAGSETEREMRVSDYQTAGLDLSRARWNAEASAVGFAGSPVAPPIAPGVVPSALLAIPVAPGKSLPEMPIARAIALELPAPSETDRVPWTKLAERFRPSVHIDETSRALMRQKAPLDWSTGKPKALDDAGFTKLVEKFEEHVAEDTVRNEYALHPQIRRWIAADPGITLEALNRRIYSDLFLTPATDPWLGLVPPVVYSGIQGDGLMPKH